MTARLLRAVPLVLVLILMLYIAAPSLHANFSPIDDSQVIVLMGRRTHLPWSEMWRHILWIEPSSFRPGWFASTTLECALFGKHAVYWHALRLGMLITTVTALFVASRFVAGPVAGCVAVGYVLVGPQCEIWWRLGASESYGLLFLSVGAACMCCALREPSTSRANLLWRLGAVSLVLAGLWKASFVPLPGFLLSAALGYDAYWSGSRKFASSRAFVVALLLFWVWQVLSVLYARFHFGPLYHNADAPGAALAALQRYTVRAYYDSNRCLALIVGAMCLVLEWCRRPGSREYAFILLRGVAALLVCYVVLVLPQWVVYGAMLPDVPRYLAPASLFKGAIAVIGFWWIARSQVRFNVWVQAILAAVLFASIAWHGVGQRRTCQQYVSVTRSFHSKLQDIKSAVSEGGLSAILLVSKGARHYELSHSFVAYLKTLLPAHTRYHLVVQTHDDPRSRLTPLFDFLDKKMANIQANGSEDFEPLGSLRTAGSGRIVQVVLPTAVPDPSFAVHAVVQITLAEMP
jgi:hypothetical protein